MGDCLKMVIGSRMRVVLRVQCEFWENKSMIFKYWWLAIISNCLWHPLHLITRSQKKCGRNTKGLWLPEELCRAVPVEVSTWQLHYCLSTINSPYCTLLGDAQRGTLKWHVPFVSCLPVMVLQIGGSGIHEEGIKDPFLSVLLAVHISINPTVLQINTSLRNSIW